MDRVSRNVATTKAYVHMFVHLSVCRSVRWFISDGFVMLLLLGDLWPWTYGRMVGDVYGRGSGLVFTTVSRQFLGSGLKGTMTVGTITYQGRSEEEEKEEDSLWSLPLLLL